MKIILTFVVYINTYLFKLQLNWFDIFIIIVIVFSFIKGYKSGFVMQLASLLGLIACAFFAGKVSEIISPYLLSVLDAKAYITLPLTYVIAFLLIIMAFLLIGKAIEGFLKMLMLNFINRIAGSAFSVLKWLFLISIILNIIIELDNNQRIIKSNVRENSLTFSHVKKISPYFIPFLNFDITEER